MTDTGTRDDQRPVTLNISLQGRFTKRWTYRVQAREGAILVECINRWVCKVLGLKEPEEGE
jgi:hypothetical protein